MPEFPNLVNSSAQAWSSTCLDTYCLKFHQRPLPVYTRAAYCALMSAASLLTELFPIWCVLNIVCCKTILLNAEELYVPIGVMTTEDIVEVSVGISLYCTVAYATRASLICASQAILCSCDVCRSQGSEVPWISALSWARRLVSWFCHSCVTLLLISFLEIRSTPVLSLSISFRCFQIVHQIPTEPV
jgi:hypothetical protein